mmetsp:Transcript_3470/g.5411  ORF Transcript_3470/g.5411 Transcript_3470/m.5411 type:complete len:297 (+) Transcript_3470:38-928(+)
MIDFYRGSLKWMFRYPTLRVGVSLRYSHNFNGIRVNKCVYTLSRRQADKAIADGRISVNSRVAFLGQMVYEGDIVELDGKVIDWAEMVHSKQTSQLSNTSTLVYLKYWKPVGVTCTTDRGDPSNIIDAGEFERTGHRVFSVGRLDRNSSGLILMTNDSRVNDAFLHPNRECQKIYEVTFNTQPTDEQVAALAAGVPIRSKIHRSTAIGMKKRSFIAHTASCQISKYPDRPRTLSIQLTEGRNRQIRLMAAHVGLEVDILHRIQFGGIGLSGLSEGTWSKLNDNELDIIRNMILKIK